MKTLKLTIYFVFIFSLNAFAQNTIKGLVTDANGPIGFVNVVLHSLPDSNTVTVVSTDLDGKYVIENIENGDYFLEALMLSYKDLKSESFKLSNETISLNMNMVEQ